MLGFAVRKPTVISQEIIVIVSWTVSKIQVSKLQAEKRGITYHTLVRTENVTKLLY